MLPMNRARWACLLRRIGTAALVLLVASATSSLAAPPEGSSTDLVGMTIGGNVVEPDGRPCPRCWVFAYNETTGRVWDSVSDDLGAFAIRSLPSGAYLLSTSGSGGYLAISTPIDDSISRNNRRIDVRLNLNVAGLTVVAPRRDRQASSVAVGIAAASTGTLVQCDPKPQSPVFNGVQLLVLLDTHEEVLHYKDEPDDTKITCGGKEALGCTTGTPKTLQEIDCKEGKIVPPIMEYTIDIKIHGDQFLRPVHKKGYFPEPLSKEFCASICTDGIGSYNGVAKHECAHRRAVQEILVNAFQELADALRNLQNELDTCGEGRCSCISMMYRINEAVKALNAKMDGLVEDQEGVADRAECDYYKSLCPR